MNPLSNYLSTCRYVMAADFANKETWVELHRYLPYLRQSLSCCVCRKVIKIPMGPSHGVCQHFVCSCCIGGKMKLKPQCSWCKNYEGFVEKTQIRIAVLCFKKLCEYILNSPIGDEIEAVSKASDDESLLDILKEASEFEDDFEMAPSSLTLPPVFTTMPTQSHTIPDAELGSPVKGNSSKKSSDQPSCTAACEAKEVCSKDETVQPVKQKQESLIDSKEHESKSCELTINNSHNCFTASESDSDSSEIDVTSTDKMVDLSVLRKESQHKDSNHLLPLRSGSLTSKGSNSVSYTMLEHKSPSPKRQKTCQDQREVKLCKCGRGGTNSRLTCLGQRCPCYINKLPCIGCKCQGCRNPRKLLKVDEELRIVKKDNLSGINLENEVNSENILV